MKVRAVFVLLFVGCSFGAWWLLGGAGPSGDPGLQPESNKGVSTSSFVESVALGEGEEPTASGRRAEVVEPVDLDEPQPEPRRFHAAPSRSTGTLLVHVVDRATGSPQPAAEVAMVGPTDEALSWYLQLAEGYWGPRVGYWAPLLSSLLRGEGIRNGDAGRVAWYRADDEGWLRVPRVAEGLVLVVERDGRCEGLMYITGEQSAAGGRLELPVGPAKSLDVLVRDVTGAPVPGVYLELSPAGPNNGLDSTVASVGRTTDEAGRCRLWAVELVSPVLFGSGSAELVVSPIGPELRRTFELHDLPDEPVVFEVPAGVGVDVYVLDALGQPADGWAYSVDLGGVDSGESFRVTGWPEAGVCRVDGLPPGAEVTVSVWFADEQTSAEVNVTLSTEIGTRQRIDLELPAPSVVLVGRLVDEQGQALGAVEFAVQLKGRTQEREVGWRFVHRTSDEVGRFAIRGQWDPGGPLLDASFKLEILESGGVVAVASSGSLDWSPDGHELAVGDLVVRPLPRIASGVVVDQDGLPIAGARIQVETEDSGYMRIGRPSDGGRDFWTHRGAEPCTTDEAGRFEVRGELVQLEIRLVAFHEGYSYRFPELVTSEGARDLKLVMDRAGELAGVVELPASQDWTAWFVLLVPVGELRHPLTFINESHRLEADGLFTVPDVAPGAYDLFVMRDGFSDPKAVVEGVSVEAGEVCGDERLWHIAPFAERMRIALEMTAPAEQVVESCEVFVRQAGRYQKLSELARRLQPGETSTMQLFVRELPVELLVASDGCRDILLEGVDRDQSLELEPGLPIELTVHAEPEQLEGLRLSVSSVPQLEGSDRWSLSNGGLDPEGRYRTTVGGPGRYSVAIFRVRPDEDIELVDVSTFEVAESPSLQSFELELP